MKFLKTCIIGLVVLSLMGGCDLAGPAGTAPSPAAVAATPSFTAVLPDTPAPSSTSVPRPTRRATAEFPTITSLPSETPIPLTPPSSTPRPTLGPPTLSGPPGPFQCKVLSVEPAPGQIMRPQRNFTAIWKIVNVGNVTWQTDDVAFFFLGGTEFQGSKYKVNFIPYLINVGDQLNLHVPMKAPKVPGTYAAHWGLRSKSAVVFFCNVSVFIIVE